ncbi:MAG: ATP-binding protein [Candidatus Latescibacterota bacterium]
MERILPAVKKMLALIRQMSDLGKPEETRLEALDLREELRRTLEPLEHLGVMKHCRVEVRADEGVPLVHGDPAQMAHVFRNLVVNAAQAMEDSAARVLTVEIGRVGAGDGVQVVVADTGKGILAEHLERIFQPFFTTKPGGTGLGLAIVRSILDRHGASVAVESQPAAGTRFVLRFPATTALR